MRERGLISGPVPLKLRSRGTAMTAGVRARRSSVATRVWAAPAFILRARAMCRASAVGSQPLDGGDCWREEDEEAL